MSTVRIMPGQMSDSLSLRSNSALAGCTTVDADDAGPFFTLKWPSISTGEKMLWRVLAWLNGAKDCPTSDDLAAHLDAGNLEAARAAIAAGSGVSA